MQIDGKATVIATFMLAALTTTMIMSVNAQGGAQTFAKTSVKGAPFGEIWRVML
jgi:hypothetical protein